MLCRWSFFFFQAEDGIRDADVTGVQTCALPICMGSSSLALAWQSSPRQGAVEVGDGDQQGAQQSDLGQDQFGKRLGRQAQMVGLGLGGAGRAAPRGCGHRGRSVGGRRPRGGLRRAGRWPVGGGGRGAPLPGDAAHALRLPGERFRRADPARPHRRARRRSPLPAPPLRPQGRRARGVAQEQDALRPPGPVPLPLGGAALRAPGRRGLCERAARRPLRRDRNPDTFVAQIGAAVGHFINAGVAKKAKEQAAEAAELGVAFDVTEGLASPVPWERAAALAVVAAQADVVPDELLEPTLRAVVAATAGMPQSRLGSQVDREALGALAALSERVPAGLVDEALAVFERLLDRPPGQANVVDDDLRGGLFGLHRAHPSRQEWIGQALLRCIQLGGSLGYKTALMPFETDLLGPLLPGLREQADRGVPNAVLALAMAEDRHPAALAEAERRVDWLLAEEPRSWSAGGFQAPLFGRPRRDAACFGLCCLRRPSSGSLGTCCAWPRRGPATSTRPAPTRLTASPSSPNTCPTRPGPRRARPPCPRPRPGQRRQLVRQALAGHAAPAVAWQGGCRPQACRRRRRCRGRSPGPSPRARRDGPGLG